MSKKIPTRLKGHSLNRLQEALQVESREFELYYLWLEKHMPPAFFEEFTESQVITITHNMMSLALQSYFVQTHFTTSSIVMCLDSPEADLKILKNYASYGIQHYQTFVSNEPLPDSKDHLRIAVIYFTKLTENEPITEEVLSSAARKEAYTALHKMHPDLSESIFHDLLQAMTTGFLRTLNLDRLILAIDVFFRARTRDHLQYEVRYHENWKDADKPLPSMQIVFAWKNTQKHSFLLRLAKLVFRHNLVMKRVNATYIRSAKVETILLMSVALHGQGNKPAWEATDISQFLRELATLKYFSDTDLIEETFVSSRLLSGNDANLIRSFVSLVHQFLLPIDLHFYSLANIEEGLCRHPDLTVLLAKAFEQKFMPQKADLGSFTAKAAEFRSLVDKLDTGNVLHDTRRKNILQTAMLLIEYTDKTNFYRSNKSALAFRLNPQFMDRLPYERKERFPELPFAIFFLKGQCFTGFHVRFKDLSRGGLRTVLPLRPEVAAWERANIFAECYNLAFTQQKKNKDIPEGGAKGVIFVEPLVEIKTESDIYKSELIQTGMPEAQIESTLKQYFEEARLTFLYQSQRAYIYTLVTLVNCRDDGTLKAEEIVDYYHKPEYLYLGPDENMHNSMIEWIAEHAKETGYKPGKAFISSKPTYGINHKEFGITSFGVNVYMHKLLEYIGIDPTKDPFTVKISGGPDGDVAGNQIYNLYRFYPKTAKLLAITDVSGTIYDPEGLDLEELVKLFHEGKPIRFYPAEKLHNEGFLLDLHTRREESSYKQETLCLRKEGSRVVKDWMIGNDTQHLFSHNLHQVISDIFIPGGGRPRTLNASNWEDFLDPTGEPTSKAIVEGANLYLTNEARAFLEKKGVLIIKDSSANKAGVMCSSLEVLSGLLLTEEEFLKEKPALMKDVFAFIEEKAASEANLLLTTHTETNQPLTVISDEISKKINTFTYQILDFLEPFDLPKDPNTPLMQCLINYCLPLFRTKYKDRIFTNIPPIHQKAMIACYIGSKAVYERGLSWSPSIVDILPILISDFEC